MAQCAVTYTRVDASRNLPVYSRAGKTEELSTSGTAATTTATADAGDYCRITNTGSGVMWASCATTATVAGATTYIVPAGGTVDIGPLLAGDKASVIDDS